MGITVNELKSEILNLLSMVERIGDSDIVPRDKIVLSDLMAETIQLIRRKYKITTLYYAPSEIKAMSNIGEVAQSHKNPDSKWIVISDEITQCPHCNKITTGAAVQEFLLQSDFCPSCGHRMER